MHPKISVIIPCFNLGTYIEACLESIACQYVHNVEFIFVNDGSTDNTLNKLNHFAIDKPHCKVIDQPNSGVSVARNKALDICKGEYVYLLDGDDILTPNSIKMMLNDVSDDIADVIISRFESVKNGKVMTSHNSFSAGIYSPIQLYESCDYFDPAPQLLYRSSIIQKYGLRFNSHMRLGEVYDFTIRFLLYAKVIKVVDNCYFRYVQRPSSATQKPMYKRDLSIVYTINEYNKNSDELKFISSFILTNYKILMSFTYNKYIRLGLKSTEAYLVIKQLLSNPSVKECLRSVANTKRIPIRDRLLARYVLCTGLSGYKLLNTILRKR